MPIRSLFLVLIALTMPSVQAMAQEAKRLTRVFFQDEDTKTVRWADLMSGQPLKLSTPQVVKGFPSLDPMKQTLVQMEMAQGYILIGVRDEQDGKFQSGWVLIDCGVETESHGDHLDWVYARDPQVRAVQLDDQQGNPAHLYVYDDVFYVANDRKNGFTRLAPSELRTTDGESAIRAKASFHSGGGGISRWPWPSALPIHRGSIAMAPTRGEST